MKLTRRALLGSAAMPLAGVLLLRDASGQTGETVEYSYDVHGRLVRAEYSNGVVVEYTYDNAGNRSQVVRTGGLPPPPFTATIPITGSTPINLRTLANTAGYNGADNALITFTLANGVTITGAAGSANGAGGIAIDTGDWPTSTYSISLTIDVSGIIRGGGGGGGTGGGDNTNGLAAGAGADAIYARVPCAVVVNPTGVIGGGGGGGGGGGTWSCDNNGVLTYRNGGGGGGGFPNGAAGPKGPATAPNGIDVASNGSAGSGAGGGAGGSGGPSGIGRTTGPGGAGGNAGAAGADGGAASGLPPGQFYYTNAPGSGGAAGYAIRKNGHTVSVTNNGTINGTVG